VAQRDQLGIQIALNTGFTMKLMLSPSAAQGRPVILDTNDGSLWDMIRLQGVRSKSTSHKPSPGQPRMAGKIPVILVHLARGSARR
jgi:hypothetical protein